MIIKEEWKAIIIKDQDNKNKNKKMISTKKIISNKTIDITIIADLNMNQE